MPTLLPPRASSARRGGALLVCALASVWLTLQVAPAARAAPVVKYTIHVPASVQINPCFPGDVVNLSGDIHIVITSTSDRAGGYRIKNHLNSELKGVSLTTGTRYVNSEDQDEQWYARPPFPAVHTHTYDFDLISQSGVDNYVLHMTMHETVQANGVPTATVDNYWMDCTG